jgi:sortase B
MKLFNSKKSVVSEQKVDGTRHLPFGSLLQNKFLILCVVVFIISLLIFVTTMIRETNDNKALESQQTKLYEDMQMATENSNEIVENKMLPEYKALYEQNDEFIGWLKIEDTVINYPVMQCLEDENFYLSHDFYKAENSNGCLILDNDSKAGVGTRANEYVSGSKPSTNLIIHGHTMKSGQMFGDLNLYKNKEYGLSHKIICFDSLYEKREYELISVFYSQVYYEEDDVFKYYKFFQADSQEEFDEWYNNINEMSRYDTGVISEYGDEFITLSCCAYHVEDGRFVVVAKRIK